jgi:hypothetical protein
MIIDKTYALLSLRPTASFAVVNDEIQWFDTIQTQPTQSEINAEIIRLQAEYDAQEYARKRAAEYPQITDYIDGVVKGDQAQIDAYIAACQAVKTKYPKPE